MAMPGTVRSASATEWSWRDSISERSMTVTLDMTCVSGTSTWLADTTTDSETAPTDSVIVPTSSAGFCSSMVTDAALKPSIDTRRFTRPRGGASTTNSPRASVRTEASGPSPVAITRAPATGFAVGIDDPAPDRVSRVRGARGDQEEHKNLEN